MLNQVGLTQGQQQQQQQHHALAIHRQHERQQKHQLQPPRSSSSNNNNDPLMFHMSSGTPQQRTGAVFLQQNQTLTSLDPALAMLSPVASNRQRSLHDTRGNSHIVAAAVSGSGGGSALAGSAASTSTPMGAPSPSAAAVHNNVGCSVPSLLVTLPSSK